MERTLDKVLRYPGSSPSSATDVLHALRKVSWPLWALISSDCQGQIENFKAWKDCKVFHPTYGIENKTSTDP